MRGGMSGDPDQRTENAAARFHRASAPFTTDPAALIPLVIRESFGSVQQNVSRPAGS